jgi:hypothetical protein
LERMRLSEHAASTEEPQRLPNALVTVAEVGVTVLPGANGEVAVFRADRQLLRLVSESRPFKNVEQPSLIPAGIKGFVVALFDEVWAKATVVRTDTNANDLSISDERI